MDNYLPVFGGAFNPPHVGHAGCIASLLKVYKSVLVVPSAAHAFGKVMLPLEQRIEMLNLLFENYEWRDRVVILPIEATLTKQGKAVYSYDLLAALAPSYPNNQLKLALGPDNLEPSTFSKFYRSQDIMKEFGVIQVTDQGGERSTFCRQKLSDLESPEEMTASLSPYLPQNVLDYAIQHKLYKAHQTISDREESLVSLLKEARKIIRASSSRNLAKDWDQRATEILKTKATS